MNKLYECGWQFVVGGESLFYVQHVREYKRNKNKCIRQMYSNILSKLNKL